MGSEVFNLKSLYLEDTVVRGARVSINNASSTRTIEVNPGDKINVTVTAPDGGVRFVWGSNRFFPSNAT